MPINDVAIMIESKTNIYYNFYYAQNALKINWLAFSIANNYFNTNA